jgi:hypothetical protein
MLTAAWLYLCDLEKWKEAAKHIEGRNEEEEEEGAERRRRRRRK